MRLSLDGMKSTLKSMVGAQKGVDAQTQASVEKFTKRLYTEIYITSPVDTGHYKNSWRMERPEPMEIHIINDADYANHLIYPNTQMIGATGADRPSVGILHNVRGIVHNHRGKLDAQIEGDLQSHLRV